MTRPDKPTLGGGARNSTAPHRPLPHVPARDYRNDIPASIPGEFLPCSDFVTES